MLDYKKTIENLTREQKIALLSNAATALDGVDPVAFAPFDDDSEESSRFPSLRAVTRSWNKDLASSVASGIAEQAKAEGKNALVLGKNLSMCNPYFDGLSEDSYLAGRMGNAFTSGTKAVNGTIGVCEIGIDNLQKTYLDEKIDVGTSYKFFVEPALSAMKGSAQCVALCENGADNAPLMRSVVENAKRNGIVARKGLDAKQTLEAALKGEVVFGGKDDELRKVMDAYDDLSQQVIAGRRTREELAAAVSEKKAISDDSFDEALENALKLIDYCNQDKFAPQAAAHTFANDIALLKRACTESSVLLKNENDVLPIEKGRRVALLGIDAEKSIGNQAFYDVFEEYCSTKGYVFMGYAPANGDDNDFDERAKNICANADVIVCVFAKDEEEHSTLSLPFDCQKLARELSDYSLKSVAVVFSDSPLDMSFDKAFSSVLFVPQSGEMLFESVCDMIFGKESPSGRLPFTLHDRADDYYAQRRRAKSYRKIGSFVGYRYYDTANVEVKYPFGFGLSYADFEYSDLSVKGDEVSFTVTNVSQRQGDAVCQIYLGRSDENLPYAKKELVGFTKISLNPSEKKTVRMKIEAPYEYDESKRAFLKDGGKYVVYVCASATDVRLSGNIALKGDSVKRPSAKLSDYIPVASEDNKKEYRFDGIEHRKKNVGGILISVLFMLVGVAVDALLYFEKDMFDATVFWVIVAVANLLVLSSIIALITFSTKGKKKKKVVSDNISSVAAKENDLFKEAFPDTDPLAALNDSKKSTSQRKRNYDDAEWFDFDKKYGFDVMFADFKTYCKERGFVLSDNTVRSTLSAIASSRIIVVDADEKTFHNFVVLASGYFGTRPYFDVVNPTLIKSKMLKTDKDGAQVGSGFASACMSAKNKGKTVFYMLKNVDFANTAYLNDLCESAKHARKRDTSGSTGCAVTENLRVCIRKNGWCVPSALAKVSALVRPEIEFTVESATKTTLKVPDYRQLVYTSDSAVKNFAMREDRWKKLDKEESEIAESVDYVIDNKDWQRIERFSSAFIAMSDLSEDKADAAYDSALDETLFAILIENMLGCTADVKKDDWSLASSIERNFGDVVPKSVREVRNAVEAAGGKDD